MSHNTPLTLNLPNQQPQTYTRPIIMGILNLTPDSFSDGNQHNTPQAALQHAQQMIAQGADIIDVGPESTRPGATRIPPDQQINRITPLIQNLANHIQQTQQKQQAKTLISIDTTHASVAAAALDQGAHIINDISAATEDPAILNLAANRNAPIILMHKQGSPATMQQNPTYTNPTDPTTEIRDYLLTRAQAAQHAGLPQQQIILDPGIGFGKTLDHNLHILAHLDQLVATNHPILLGASRKSFIAHLAERNDQPPPDTDHRLGATLAATTLAVAAGVAIIRVHDVAPNRQAADLTHALTHTP